MGFLWQALVHGQGEFLIQNGWWIIYFATSMPANRQPCLVDPEYNRTHCTWLTFVPIQTSQRQSIVLRIGRTATIIHICCFDFFSEHHTRCQRWISLYIIGDSSE
jgi:hypothetical protein